MAENTNDTPNSDANRTDAAGNSAQTDVGNVADNQDAVLQGAAGAAEAVGQAGVGAQRQLTDQTQTLTVDFSDDFILPAGITEAQVDAKGFLEQQGGSLLIHLPSGNVITLQDFFVISSQGLPPALSLADGTLMNPDQIITVLGDAFDPAAVETAAGGGGGGGGGGAAFTAYASGDIGPGGQEIGLLGNLPGFPFQLPQQEEQVADRPEGTISLAASTAVTELPPGEDGSHISGTFAGAFEDAEPNQFLGDTSVHPAMVNIVFTPGDNEILTGFTLTDIPSDVQLFLGTEPLVPVDGAVTVAPDQINNIFMIPPSDTDADVPLGYVADVLDPDTGEQTTLTGTFVVTVDAVADVPSVTPPESLFLEQSGVTVPIDLHIASNDADGSESLSVVLGNIPDGVTFNQGTDNHNGTWTFTPDQLEGLTMTVGADVKTTFVVDVTGIATEHPTDLELTTANNVATFNTSFAVNVDIPSVIDVSISDDPNDSAVLVGGNQLQDAETDQPVTVHLGLSVELTLGSEPDSIASLNIAFDSLPDGTTASTGTLVGNQWSGNAADLADLALTFPTDYSVHPGGAIDATITAQSTLGAVDSLGFSIALSPEGDVTVSAPDEPIQASEDGNLQPPVQGEGPLLNVVNLGLSAAPTDADGSESLQSVVVTLTDVPGGTGILLNFDTNSQANYAFEANDHGSFTLTITGVSQSELPSLSLGLPPDYAGQIAGHIDVATDEGGNASDDFSIVVAATPDLNVSANGEISAAETDAPVPVHLGIDSGPDNGGLSVSVDDSDGSEVVTSVSIAFTGLPDGAGVNGGSLENGVWTGTPAELAALVLTLPQDYSSHVGGADFADITAVLNATTNEGGDISVPFQISVSVEGDIAVTASDVATDETNAAITVNLGVDSGADNANLSAAATDADGSESLTSVTVTFTGLPEGAEVNGGTLDGAVWSGTAAQLAQLQLTLPADYSGEIGGTLHATTDEGGDESANFAVTINATADLQISTGEGASGAETDASITVPLGLSATISDSDGSETFTLVQVSFSNLPSGAATSGGGTFDSGTGVWTGTATQLANLALVLPADYSSHVGGATYTDITGTLHVTTNEGGDESANFSVPVSVEADLAVSGQDVAASETNAAITINLGADVGQENANLSATVSDADGSEAINSLTVTFTGLPEGTTLDDFNGGDSFANGVWSGSATDLANLTLTLPADFSGDVGGTLHATTDEGGDESANFTISIAPTADLQISTGEGASGAETDASITVPLGLTANITDSDGSETFTLVQVSFSNLPSGAATSGGGTFDSGTGVWTGTATELANLALVLPADYSSHVGGDVYTDISGTLHVTTNEGGDESANFSVPVSVEADLAVSGQDVAASETNAALTINLGAEVGQVNANLLATVSDADGSEAINSLTVTFTGLPSGITLDDFSGGDSFANGVWSGTATELANLTLTLPADFSGDVGGTLHATTDEGGDESANFTISVAPTSDLEISTGPGASGEETDASITVPLGLSATISDSDGSETFTLVQVSFSNLPSGATTSGGGSFNGTTGVWTGTATELANLALVLPADYSSHVGGDVYTDITGTLHVTTNEGGDESAGFSVPVSVEADLAVSGQNVSGTETNAAVTINLGADVGQVNANLSATVSDADGSEAIKSLTVTFTGLPSGATVNGGTLDGAVWSGTANELANLTLTVPADFSGNVGGTLHATTDEGGDESANFTISIAPTGDLEISTGDGASGAETDSQITVDLGLSATITDSDNSETFTLVQVSFSNLPSGATTSGGGSFNSTTGVWTGTATQLANLALVLPKDYSSHVSGTTYTDITGTLHVTTNEGGDESANFSVPVSVEADLAVSGQDVAATETDSAITVNLGASTGGPNADLSATVSDADGSESLTSVTVTFTGLPEGASVNGGTLDGAVWTGTATQLANLTLTLPADFSGDIGGTLNATTDEGGDEDATFTIEVESTPDVLSNDAIDVYEAGLLASAGADFDGSMVGDTTTQVSTLSFADNIDFGTDGKGEVTQISIPDVGTFDSSSPEYDDTSGTGIFTITGAFWTLVVTATGDNAGDYTFTLDNHTYHDSTAGEGDSLDLPTISVTMTDGNGDPTLTPTTLVVSVHDDELIVDHYQDGHIANTPGTVLTGELSLTGADWPATGSEFNLAPTVAGATDTFVAQSGLVTSTGQPIYYYVKSGSENVLYATTEHTDANNVTDDNAHTVFIVTADPTTETYSVDLHQALGTPVQLSLDLTSVANAGGPRDYITLEGVASNLDDPSPATSAYGTITGWFDTDGDGLLEFGDDTRDQVNPAQTGMGVSDANIDSGSGQSADDVFRIDFTDSNGTPNDTPDLVSTTKEVTLTFTGMSTNENLSYLIHLHDDGNAGTSDTITGTFSGSGAGGDSVLALTADNVPALEGRIIDAIDIVATDGGFKLQTADVYRIGADGNKELSFLAQATDSDGDPLAAPVSFDVNFQGDTTFDHNMVATDGDEVFQGSDDNEVFLAGTGNDVVYGGGGDDTIEGGTGADTIDGQAGSDTASYRQSASAVAVDLAAHTASGGDATGDSLTSIENLVGSAYDDTLTGDTSSNVLTGGGGSDTLTGGGGDDTFVYGQDALNGSDTIQDFNTGDTINLDALFDYLEAQGGTYATRADAVSVTQVTNTTDVQVSVTDDGGSGVVLDNFSIVLHDMGPTPDLDAIKTQIVTDDGNP